MATGFTLRATTCPGCGARVPVQAGRASVTCEYCGLVAQVVEKRPPGPSRRLPSNPGGGYVAPAVTVTPSIRPGFTVLFVMIPILLTTGVSWYVALSGRAHAPAPTVTAPASEDLSSLAVSEPREATTPAPEPAPEPVPAPVPVPVPAAPEPDADAATPAPRQKRKPKPKPYEIARIIKPGFRDCKDRDLMAPGHPVYYKPTVKLSVQDGAFANVDVSIEVSDTDLSKLRFSGDSKREVTQADLDRRAREIDRCITRAIESTPIPTGHAQAKAQGRVLIRFTHDGVPYGVKNL